MHPNAKLNRIVLNESKNEKRINLGNGIIIIDEPHRTKDPPIEKRGYGRVSDEDRERYAEDVKALKEWAERSHRNAKNARSRKI